MRKINNRLGVLLYAVLFGAFIATITGSPLTGVVCLALALFTGSVVKLPKGSLAIGATNDEDEVDYVKEIGEKITEIKSSIDKKADVLEIEKLKLELQELRQKATDEERTKTNDMVTELKTQLIDLGNEVTKMKTSVSDPSSGDSVAKELKANMETLKKMAKEKGSNQSLEIKALTLRANITNNDNAFDLPDIGQLATRQLSMYDIFPKLRLGKGNHNGVVRYYDWDEATIARAAAMVAEGAAFPESTAKWKRGTIDLKKVGDTIPVTEEFFEDEQMFAAEIQMFLQTNVDLEVDNQIANGDGTGNNLTGLFASIGAYTPVASGIQDASIYDLVVKVKESITTTGGAKYRPDVIIMNISDINKYKLKKDQNDNYVMPPFVSRDGNQIDGMLVIEANIVTANTMVVCDRRFGRIYEMAGMTIETGYVGTQFTEDEMTLKIRKRLAFLVRGADAGGFKKVTDITAALTTLAS